MGREDHIKFLHMLKGLRQEYERGPAEGSAAERLATKPDSLRLSLGPTWWDERTDSHRLSFDLPLCIKAQAWNPSPLTNTKHDFRGGKRKECSSSNVFP